MCTGSPFVLHQWIGDVSVAIMVILPGPKIWKAMSLRADASGFSCVAMEAWLGTTQLLSSTVGSCQECPALDFILYQDGDGFPSTSVKNVCEPQCCL
jgi:hypothetical protein